ncbi:MAG: acetyl-CoA carboxylase biotin carboxylase subunit family protein, partial [Acidimicrobiia bacterium]
MPRVLLILPTSTYRAPDFLAAARALGVDIVVASEGDQALAEQMGDGFLQVDCRRPEQAAAQIVEAARPNPLDAVIAADDQGVLVAAIAAQQLGLSHNPPEAVAATRDKALMRRLLAKGGIPQPDFRVVRPGDDVPQAASQIGLPCVVKPVGLSGSRG